MNGKRVLVTGGTGFIGSHLVPRLVAAGAKVTVAVPPHEVTAQRTAGVETVTADLRDRSSVNDLAALAPAIVFHLGGFSLVGESYARIDECFDLNAKGTALLVGALKGVESFVYASTADVYGTQPVMPLEESMVPAPASPYAVSKYAGELSCFARQRAPGNGTRFAVLRLFNVFGPGQRLPALIPDLLGSCLSGAPIQTTRGEQTRELNYVEDIVDGLVAAAECTSVLDGPINLCSGRETAIRDLVRLVAQMTGTKSPLGIGALPYRPNEVWRVFGDGARAARLLGWRPRVSLEEGLTRTIAHARAQAT